MALTDMFRGSGPRGTDWKAYGTSFSVVLYIDEKE